MADLTECFLLLTLQVVALEGSGAEIRRMGFLQEEAGRLGMPHHSYTGDSLFHLYRLFQEVQEVREDLGVLLEQRDRTKPEMESVFVIAPTLYLCS